MASLPTFTVVSSIILSVGLRPDDGLDPSSLPPTLGAGTAYTLLPAPTKAHVRDHPAYLPYESSDDFLPPPGQCNKPEQLTLNAVTQHLYLQTLTCR
jgi:hypothetical protein